MKVAIVGAGLAGLACAHEFERHGITPTIFERKRRIGEDVDFVTSTLKLFDLRFRDPLKYLSKNFDINLIPTNILREIDMCAPNNEKIVRGTSGYIFVRGEYKHSLENQLASLVKTPINFYKHIYIDDIKKEFDYVVNATGIFDYAKQMNLYTQHFQGFVRMAVVSGSFDTSTIKMWVNTEYSKTSFCYLLPHSHNKACLVAAVNDITQPDLDYYWEKFISSEKITNLIIKTRDTLHETGLVTPHKSGNVYFVGNAGGMLGSILGFGMVNSITSGALAARSIVKKYNYEKLIRPINKYIEKKYEYRKIINKFDNNDFDLIINFLGIPGIKHLLYRNPFAKVTHGSFFAKLYNEAKRN